MRVEYEAWEEAMRLLVQVRANPDATQADNAAAVRRAGDTMAALLRRVVTTVDTLRRSQERYADQVSTAIDAGDQDIYRVVSDLMARIHDLDERLRALEAKEVGQ